MPLPRPWFIMNRIDLLLVVVLLGYMLRGYWRGFFRECLGVIGLVGGLVAAGQMAPAGAALLHQYLQFPPLVEMGVAFVVSFVGVDAFCGIVGALLGRRTDNGVARVLSHLAGAFAGAAKGLVVAAFVLLFLHLFPIAPDVDEYILSSSMARSLIAAAGDVVRLSVQCAAPPDVLRHS